MDETTKTLTQIQTDIAIIKNDLQHHIRRTDLAEENVKLIRDEMKFQNNGIKDELKPIKKHIAMVDGVVRFLGILSLALGVALTIYKLINFD